jgi:arylsulfatase A-like enzyme
MRLLFIDVDSLRADHLGCYGYHRKTSPTFDALAERGVRFDQCYVSDAPCLPSRTAWATGRFGFHNGVVSHGGKRAEPFNTSEKRIQDPDPEFHHWFQALRTAGLRTASISPFASRHAAWWYLAGLTEWYDTGKAGFERADEVNIQAERWLEENADQDDWVLHVNYWDPHTPYRTPAAQRGQFDDVPPPAWLTSEILERHWNSFGTLSAQDSMGYWFPGALESEREGIPFAIETVEDWKVWVDAYDEGIAYADLHVERLLDLLAAKGVLEETTVIITSDHGENLGELGVYGDHQTADMATTRVPFIMSGPNLPAAHVDSAFHYQMDLGATLLQHAGVEVPAAWDAAGFHDALIGRQERGREYLVLSQLAWSCQRQVRFGPWSYLRTYHPGLKDLEAEMLFDVETDPHETRNLAPSRQDVVREARSLLQDWFDRMMASSQTGADPMWTVLEEGGPSLARGYETVYLERLQQTNRAEAANRLGAVLNVLKTRRILG